MSPITNQFKNAGVFLLIGKRLERIALSFSLSAIVFGVLLAAFQTEYARAKSVDTNPAVPTLSLSRDQALVHVTNLITLTDGSAAAWRDECVPRRMQISGIGMGDGLTMVHSRTLLLTAPVTDVLVQVAGRSATENGLPDRVVFTSNAPQVIALNQPITYTSHGYAFVTRLAPATQITAVIDSSGNKTTRGFIIYASQSVSDSWTSVGQLANEFVYWNSPSKAYTHVFTLPELEAATDLWVTAVIIDNNNDDRPMVLRAEAGGVTNTLSITYPTNGDLLNITDLTLRQVPEGTNRVSITLESPVQGNIEGDSLVLVGMNVSYPCAAQAEVDLGVTQTDAPDPVIVQNSLTYTIVITNTPSLTATNVILTDTLPPGATLNAASPGCQGVKPQVVSCHLGIVAASRLITIVVTPTLAGVDIPNTVVVTSQEPDSDPTNNEDIETTTVYPNIQVDLRVTQTDTPDPVTMQNPLTYTISVTNSSFWTATNVILTDTLPPGATLNSASSGCLGVTPQVVSCQLGIVVDSRWVTIVVTPTLSKIEAITIPNSVTVTSQEPDINPDDNTSVETTAVNPHRIYLPIVLHEVDVWVTKTSMAETAVVGLPLTYTITVDSNLRNTIKNVVVTDTLPASVDFSAASSGCQLSNASTLRCDLGNVGDVSGDDIITVVVTPNEAGTIANIVTVTSSEPDSNSSNNTDIDYTIVHRCIPEPNQSFALAKGPLTPGRPYCGHPDIRDNENDPRGTYDNDFYYIDVPETGLVSITLRSEPLIPPKYAPQNVLALYSETKLLGSCCLHPNRGLIRSLSVPITATGRYYILVLSVDISPTLTYTITWDMPTSAPAPRLLKSGTAAIGLNNERDLVHDQWLAVIAEGVFLLMALFFVLKKNNVTKRAPRS